MKKITLLFFIYLIFSSCGVKKTREALTNGNYDEAIDIAYSNLKGNKDKKGNQDYVYLLEEAFAKAKEKNLREIDLWKKENNPATAEKIFKTYNLLYNRQEKIRPILPLQLLKQGRQALFPFDDYSQLIASSKLDLSKYLYTNAKSLLATNEKMNFRRAFDDFEYLEKINPNYLETRQLMNTSYEKGLDYVFVYTKNETNMVIPQRLEDELLNFNTYGLNDRWTVYQNDKLKNVKYDYAILVSFRDIIISPEQINEKQFDKERLIKIGTKKLYDKNGVVVKDSNGKEMTVDDMQTVRASIYELRQFKSCAIKANVNYINYKSNEQFNSFPLASEYLFENIYSTYKGDKRACEDSYYDNFNRRALTFPSNEKMVYDSGEDLKSKLKSIIVSHKISQ